MREKLISVAKGALIAAAGAALYYAAQWVLTPDANLTLGPALAAILAVAINAARKALEPTPVTVEANVVPPPSAN